MKNALTAFVLFVLLAATAQAETQVYKWTDAQGRVHYSDIPPLDSKNLTQKKTAGNIIETDALPFESKLAGQKNPVTLFSFKECGDPCSKAEALLAQRGVPFTLKNTDADKNELKKLTGDTQVPALFIGTQKPKIGFEEDSWNRALDTAGYPKGNPLKNLSRAPAKTAPAATPQPSAAPADNPPVTAPVAPN